MKPCCRMAERFFELIRTLHVGVVVQGPSTEVLVCNPASLMLLGLDEDQYRGKTSYDPDWNIIREDGSVFLAQERPLARVLATGKAVRSVVMGVFRPKTKDRVWLQVDAEPELDEQGRIVQVVSTLTDITERRRLESSLMEARKLESIGRLAGGIAHDFNNLLTVITGATTMALDSLPATDPACADLNAALDAAQRGAALTRQLLTFARRRATAPTLLNIGAAVSSLMPLLSRLLGPGVSLAMNCYPDTWSARIDPVEFEQLVVNLSANARDAMPSGGVINIETSNFEHASDAPGLPRGAYVCLRVSDSGMGMEPGILERLFEPFFTTKGAGRGTGLGLAIVHGIVVQNYGHIHVESELNKGATFRVYLPRAMDESGLGLPHSIPVLGGQETILFAEDEGELLSLSKRYLERLGYKVLAARDGDEALAMVSECEAPVDLLLTDLTMPRMNGDSLALRLRARWPNLPVLITSGFANNGTFARDEWAVLDKPYTLAVLGARLREMLNANRG